MVFGNSVSGRTTEITSAVLRKDGTRAETPFSYHTQTAEYKPYGASQDSKHWLTTSGFGAPSPGDHYKLLKQEKGLCKSRIGDEDPRRHKLGQVLWLPHNLKKHGSQHNCGRRETDMQLAFGVPSPSLAAPRLSQHHK